MGITQFKVKREQGYVRVDCVPVEYNPERIPEILKEAPEVDLGEGVVLVMNPTYYLYLAALVAHYARTAKWVAVIDLSPPYDAVIVAGEGVGERVEFD